ncbi:hypothetical protein SGCOL_001398 [Colletotrichum sp. CLE4]
MDEIRDQLHIWQTTELPGMVNTEVIKILYKTQSEQWQRIAEQHIENIADDVETASNWILEDLSLEAFIRYVTNDIVEDFVSYSKGPLLGLSTDWVFMLTDEEVEKLAREDDETMGRRSHFDGVIGRLEIAHEIAEKARIQTRNLGDM